MGPSLEPVTLLLVSVGLKLEAGSGRDFAGALVLAAVGALALFALIAQAVATMPGAAWRAVTTRMGVPVNVPSRVRAAQTDATSTQVLVESSRVIFSRPAYRPRLLVGLTVAAVVLYAASVVGVLAQGTHAWRRAAGRWDQEAAPSSGERGGGDRHRQSLPKLLPGI